MTEIADETWWEKHWMGVMLIVVLGVAVLTMLSYTVYLFYKPIEHDGAWITLVCVSVLMAGVFGFGGVWIFREETEFCTMLYRGRHGLCENCGYDLRASKYRCPECGEPK